MEQRMEFAVRAIRTVNFRALCQEYGISTKTGYKSRPSPISHHLLSAISYPLFTIYLQT